jgi:Fe-S-cluster-containing hydrogenase component 2
VEAVDNNSDEIIVQRGYSLAIGPTHSRILPVRLRRTVVNIPVVCRQCLKPLCADACPMGALSRDAETGAMAVDPDLCIGCGMCLVACPLGGISIDTEAGHAVKCDLCGGDPLCVKFCGFWASGWQKPLIRFVHRPAVLFPCPSYSARKRKFSQ